MQIRIPMLRRSISARGHALYKQKVRSQVYPQEIGKVVLIDVCSGDFELEADEGDLAAYDRLLARRPEAKVWAERVGYPAVDSFGGGLRFNGN